MIKWTFFFDEGNIARTARTAEEDLYITTGICSGSCKPLVFEDDTLTVYVNPSQVKATSRELVTEEAAKPEVATDAAV